MRWRRLTTALLALLAVAFLVTGCGTILDPNAASPEEKAQWAKFAKCLRDHGVEVKEDSDGEGISVQSGSGDPASDKAMEACQKYEPDPKLSEEEKKESLDAALKWARCMRKHGVDVPDPVQDEKGRIKQSPPPASNAENPGNEKRAMEACESIIERGE